MSSSNEQLDRVDKTVIRKYESTLEQKAMQFVQNASMTKYSLMSLGKKSFMPFEGLNIKNLPQQIVRHYCTFYKQHRQMKLNERSRSTMRPSLNCNLHSIDQNSKNDTINPLVSCNREVGIKSFKISPILESTKIKNFSPQK